MIRNILTIPIIEINIEHIFNLSDRIIIIIRNQLNPEIISDIMIYKNHLSRHKEEFKFFDNTPISLEEKEVESELDPEETKILNK